MEMLKTFFGWGGFALLGPAPVRALTRRHFFQYSAFCILSPMHIDQGETAA